MTEYTPSPIDTSGIELPRSLDPVAERLAENVHEVWAKQRIKEGWVLGAERNDARREHPCLVPYADLPEVEKEYDRQTGLNTLKVIMMLGYRITPPADPTAGDTKDGFDGLATWESLLRARQPLPTRELRGLWEGRESHLWALHPGLYEVLADTLLKRAYPMWANDVAREGLKISPDSIRLRQLQALAMMRSGSPKGARKILECLASEGHDDSETIGLLASSHKTFWKSGTGETAEKTQALKECAELYRGAFERTRDYYPGINAAAMAVLSGDLETGRRIAGEVREICIRGMAEGDHSYWILATIAEAALIGGEAGQAVDHYKKAVAAAPGDLASISATRMQALMLAGKLGIDDSLIRQALPVPPVAIFAGLPPVRNRRTTLPVIGDEAELKEQFRREITGARIKVAYASGVGAGDLAFLETILELKGQAHLVLPAPPDDLRVFFGDSPLHGDAWIRRFDDVLAKSSSVTVVSRELGSADPEVFSYTNRILAGSAVLRSQSLGTPARLIELIDTGADVAGSFVNRSIFNEFAPIEVSSPAHWGDPIPSTTGGLNAEVKAILFADLKGYSKLPESQIPLFINVFLTKAAELCAAESGIQFRNMWGDCFYIVFDDVRAAARFAKRLREFIKDTDWAGFGFYRNFGIRIALHAGPLFSFFDPILEKATFSGQHTSRAARIEPITDEGQIFVSEPFACLAAEGNAPELEFEYLGRLPLAKGYGGEGLFLLL